MDKISELSNIDFYTKLISLFQPLIKVPLREPKNESWYKIPTNEPGIHFEWGFHHNKRSFGTEIHFEKSKREANEELSHRILNRYKPILECLADEKLLIESNWGTGQNHIRLYFEKNACDFESEDDVLKWAVRTMLVLYISLRHEYN
ncbi:DUF4268 domain-containing protein [Heliobacterium mobile]|nr:DUF4268 domain-containing protein [Heliobacterium mobile]